MRHWPALLPICLGVALMAARSWGQDQTNQQSATIDLDVIAKKLDVARQEIQPSLGASFL